MDTDFTSRRVELELGFGKLEGMVGFLGLLSRLTYPFDDDESYLDSIRVVHVLTLLPFNPLILFS